MRWLIGILFLASTAFLAGCGKETPAPPAAKAPKVNVVTPVRKKIVVWHKYTGRMAAVGSVDVRARVSGYLQSIYFEEGQDVRAGDLLLLIDPRPFDAALRSANAQLQKAKADVSVAESRRNQAIAEKKQVVAKQTLAKLRIDRMRKLLKTGAVTQDEFEEASSQYAQSVANVEAAQANIQSAIAAVDTAKASVVVGTATVENAELQLGYTRIRAPISGRISNWRITPGNLIDGGTVGAEVLTTIVALDPIQCYFDGSEREVLRYLRLVASGEQKSARESQYRNPVYMKLVDESGYPHHGHLDFVDNRIVTNTGTMRARAIFPNANRFLTPGMFAELRLPGSMPHEAILIPDAAVGSDQSQSFVYIVDGENKVARREVKLGSLRHGLRIVESGLDGSERLVVSGLQMIRAGVPVEATPTRLTVKLDDDLPDYFEPIPRDKWLTIKPTATPSAPAKTPVVAPRPGR